MEYLEWKMEPASPPGVPSSYIDDWLLRSDDIPVNALTANDYVLYDEHPTPAESKYKLLPEFNDRNEGFANSPQHHPVALSANHYFADPLPNWYEEHVDFDVDLPVYTEENYITRESVPEHPKCVPQYAPLPEHLQADQISLDQQFEDILDSIGECFPNEVGSIRQCFPDEGGSIGQVEDGFYTLTPPITPGNTCHEEEFTYMNYVPDNFLVEPKSQQNESLNGDLSDGPTSEHEYENMDLESNVSSVEDKEDSDEEEPEEPEDSKEEEKGQVLDNRVIYSPASTPENMAIDESESTQEPWAEKVIASPLRNDTTLTEVKTEVLSGDESSSTIITSTEETFSSEDLSDDPDWGKRSSCRKAKPKKALTEVKRTRKPYVKIASPEERKVRKKEQNKKAATRYRMKKKMESMGVFGQEKTLLDKNTELKGKVSGLQQEVVILKKLMRDLFRAKGLIK